MTLLNAQTLTASDDVWRVTRAAYRRMAEAGVFEGERVELIRGRILSMAAMGLPHDMGLMKSGRALRARFPESQYTVRVQQQFTAPDDSDPEPDLCVVAGPVEQIRDFPRTALLLVEIAETSLRRDRLEKAPLYAESGVADYWIVNLADRVVEVYRHPHEVAGGGWNYDAAQVFKPGDRIEPLAQPGETVAVDELLP
jgi:Uma2 family endonuclease